TQRTASMMLDFPQPLGPTMAVTPGSKWTAVLSAKLLKPWSSMRLRYMRAGWAGSRVGGGKMRNAPALPVQSGGAEAGKARSALRNEGSWDDEDRRFPAERPGA